MRFSVLSFMVVFAMMTGQASAQTGPLASFGYLPWCAPANVAVDQANQLLGQNQSLLSVKLPTTFKLIELGDKYAQCARMLSNVHVTPAQEQLQMTLMMDALEMSTEANFAATRAAADIIDLSPPSKRTADERYLFASAAHATLQYTAMVRDNTTKPQQVSRIADIQSTISELVPVYGADQLGVIYQGIPQ